MHAKTLTVLVALLALSGMRAAAVQAPINLGAASSFAVLAGVSVTNTGTTAITGDLGVSPGTAVTGFPPGTINGTLHINDATAVAAQLALTAAYDDAAGRTDPQGTFGELGGLILTPGLYRAPSSLAISSDVTLDGQGDPNAVFIFQIGSTLITGANSDVLLINGARAANIFWQVGSSATLGSGSVFAGTIMALTSITVTVNTGVTLTGRVLAQDGSVTMDNNTIVAPATVTVSGEDISPFGTSPGAVNVPMLKLSFVASASNAMLQSIKVDNRGGFEELDVATARIYLDGGDGLFDPGVDTEVGSAAMTGASGGSATVVFGVARGIGTTASVYFVAYDIASGANPAHKVTALLVDNSYIGVAEPSTVSPDNFPLQTSPETSLPVELSSFTAFARESFIEITWLTHSETENVGWRLLRADVAMSADTLALAAQGPDGMRGFPSLKQVAFVKGQGNTPWETEYVYHDFGALTGQRYVYYLVDVDIYGQETYHGPAFARISTQELFGLAENYPNPFNPSTTLRFNLPEAGDVRLVVYDVTGALVCTLVDERVEAGLSEVVWDGRDANGREVASGVYVYRLTAKQGGVTRRMVLAR